MLAGRRGLSAILFVAVVVLVVPVMLVAHHNHQAQTNYDKLLGVTGVVTEFEFINPHALLHVAATKEDGSKEEWISYQGNPGMEARIGYSSHMFKLGEERVTVYGFPSRDGRPVMTYVKLVRANGDQLQIYQTERNDLEAFFEKNHVQTFKDLPESAKRYVGGKPYIANDDK